MDQTQQPVPKKKSHKWLWILGGIVILIIIIAVAGGNGEPKKVGETNTASSNTNQQTEYAVGDTVKISDYTMTINKIERKWQSPANYDKPESGREYVLAEVTITNEGKSSISYNTFDFKMQDSNGVQKTEAYTMATNKLNSGDLAPGGKITGNLVYDVPLDATGLKLLFNPTFWGKTVTVKL
ncbi:MAG: DUF4352 domain-containing protein [Patescibacteria group bacterium]|jgi:hypothetical protein